MSGSKTASTPYTFTQIIDADHLTIQTLAAKTRRILSKIPNANTVELTKTLLPLLNEITWRLIRHDLSESLVMRPAFIATLPVPQGQEMADHDARDHANGRILLLSILVRLERLEDDGLHEIAEQIIAAFDDLGKHMAIESGEFLPYFETLIDEVTSKRLAMEYTNSLCMTPYLRIPDSSAVDQRLSVGVNRVELKSVFADVAAYVRMDLAELKGMYEELVTRAKVDVNLRELMTTATDKELDMLQVWKWRSLTASKAESNSNTDPQLEKYRTNKL